MSTGQPPSDKSSDGEKRSESGQSSNDIDTDKSEGTGSQSSNLEERWDPREAPTSSGRIVAAPPAPPPNSNRASPEFRTVPPGVSSPRGKFTVGNLLNASQGTAPISQKRADPLSVRPRQQIGALPQRALTRSTVPPASTNSDGATSPPATSSTPSVEEVPSQVETVISPPASQAIAEEAVPQVDAVVSASALQASEIEPIPEVEAGSQPTPSQPFAVEVVSSVEVVSRPTPSQPISVDWVSEVEASSRPTPSQPFVVAAVPKVESVAKPTPSQLVASEAVFEADAGSRPTPSQPFAVEVVPKSAPQTPHVERALTPRDLLAPPLIEKTPRGIGAVTLDSPGPLPLRPSNPVALESTKFAVTPIVSIVAAPPAQPAKGDASPLPTVARELDDPDSWNVDVNPAPPAIMVKPPSPVAADAPRTSDRAIPVNESDPSPVATQRSPSSQSKLARAASSETGLSGEFFAAPNVTDPPPELRQPQDSDSFIDERQRRSISPEVVARRTRYRVLVVRVIVGFILLLAAAITLKVMRKH